MGRAAGLIRRSAILPLLWSAAAGAQRSGADGLHDADAAMANARRMVAGEPCGGSGDQGDEVTVCARVDADLRHRLPLPVERAVPAAPARSGGSGVAAMTPDAPCGIFAGERRCAPAEARLYGYGGGRDPLTLGLRIATRLIDPDADIAPPPR